MKLSTMILGVLFFAIATMIIYTWGLVRQKNEDATLMNMLFQKGSTQIKKYLKSHEHVTVGEVQKLCIGLRAKLPFSKKTAVVQDKSDFANHLLAYMVKTGQLEKKGATYIKKDNK